MDYCFVEFEPKDGQALGRLGDFLKRVMIAKEDDEFDEGWTCWILLGCRGRLLLEAHRRRDKGMER